MKKLFLTFTIICSFLFCIGLVGCNYTSQNEEEQPNIVNEEAPTIETLSEEEREKIVFEMETRQQYVGYNSQLATAEAQIQAWYDEYDRIAEYENAISQCKKDIEEWERILEVVKQNIYNPPPANFPLYFSSREEIYELLDSYLDLTTMKIIKGYAYGQDVYYFGAENNANGTIFYINYVAIPNLNKDIENLTTKIANAKDTTALTEAEDYYNQCVCSCAWNGVMEELGSTFPSNESVLTVLNEWKEKNIGNDEPDWFNEILRVIRIVGGVDLSLG